MLEDPEVWKLHATYPEYEVSNHGRVRKGLVMLSIFKRPDDYLSISIRRKKQLLHRVVAFVWHENPLNLPEVNHLDGDRSNCHKGNLQWVTSQQNADHKYKVLGYKHKRGYNLPSGIDNTLSKQTACFDRNGFLKAVFESVLSAAKSIGTCPSAIGNQITKGWGTSNGYHWKYISASKFFELEGKLSEGEPYQESILLYRPI